MKMIIYLSGFTALLLITFIFSIMLEFGGVYTYGPRLYALSKLNLNNIDLSSINAKEYLTMIDLESKYPLPSLLVLMFNYVSGMPIEYVLFFPFIGIGSIALYLLSHKIITNGSKGKTSNLLLKSLAFITWLYFLIMTLQSITIERQALAFMYFIYVVLIIIHVIEKEKMNIFEFILLLIFSLSIAYSHYTITLATLLVYTGILFISVYQRLSSKTDFKILRSSIYMLSLILLLTFLFWFNEYIYMLGSGSSIINEFIRNVVDYIYSVLSSPTSLFWMPPSIVEEVMPTILTYMLRVRSIMNIINISVTIYVLLFTLLRSGFRINSYVMTSGWVFAYLIFIASLVEILYFIVIPSIISLRFLVLLSPILVLNLILRISKDRFRRIMIIAYVLLLTTSIIGTSTYNVLYGHSGAKIEGHSKAKSLASYIAEYNTNDLSYSGDSTYIVDIATSTILSGKPRLNWVSLGYDVFTLYISTKHQNVPGLLKSTRQYDMLIINLDGMPIYGKVWSAYIPSLTQSQLDFLLYNTNLVYSSRFFIVIIR